ncbi:alanine racemase [Patescibacteria group bacterium]|nr:alanine racemase [Patescibacteria group bacterium]
MLTWIEVKKSAIQHNLKQFQKIVGSTVKIMAVVKSNAYGHGMIEIAKLALGAGADWLGVINSVEALKLRQAKVKVPIFILSFWDPGPQVKQAIKQNIDFPVYTLEQAKFLSKTGPRIKRKVNVHIEIDTGTSRVGVLADRAADFIKEVDQLANLNIRGIFTHYADSESKDQSYTNWQTKKFQRVIKDLNVPLAHAGCSASTINNPNTFFNLVRIGISLYGLWPSLETKELVKRKKINIDLKPALAWKTRIIQVKQIPKATYIGYDRTYKTKKKTKLAVLPIGYWDGYNRQLSNPSSVKTGGGEILIKGERCPVLGRVCMNLTMADVTKLTKIKAGDEVVLIGQQGEEEITAEEIAAKTKTINYEVVTRINPLIPRIYI